MVVTHYLRICESIIFKLKLQTYSSTCSYSITSLPFLKQNFRRNIHTNPVKSRGISFMIQKMYKYKKPVEKDIFKNHKLLMHISAVSKDDKTDPLLSESVLTVKQILEICQKQLKEEEIDEAELNAQYILSKALEVERVELAKYMNGIMPLQSVNLIRKLMKCRLARMPIQYIFGDWEFHSLKLKLRPPVFIPRPETEILVNITGSVIKNILKTDNPVVLDVGCGSGAISLALLDLFPNLTCVAIDQSKYAVDLTIENAKDLNLIERLHVILGKVTKESFPDLPIDKFDIIVSNPPYIPQKDLCNLPPEIKLYEDMRSVFGGLEGLDIIKRIILHGQHLLKDNGHMIMEIDVSQCQTLPSWMKKKDSLMKIENFLQFNEVPRFVQLKKKRTKYFDHDK